MKDNAPPPPTTDIVVISLGCLLALAGPGCLGAYMFTRMQGVTMVGSIAEAIPAAIFSAMLGLLALGFSTIILSTRDLSALGQMRRGRPVGANSGPASGAFIAGIMGLLSGLLLFGLCAMTFLNLIRPPSFVFTILAVSLFISGFVVGRVVQALKL